MNPYDMPKEQNANSPAIPVNIASYQQQQQSPVPVTIEAPQYATVQPIPGTTQPSYPIPPSTQQIFPTVPPVQSAYPQSMPVAPMAPMPPMGPGMTSPISPDGQGNMNSPTNNVLLNPEAQFMAPSPNAAYQSPYPIAQQPKGNPIDVTIIAKNDEKKKQKNALIGVGVGAGAVLLTGGIALPLIAGAVAYNIAKNSDNRHFMAFPNSYVYELRVAIARELNVRPEVVLLERKDIAMDDNEQLMKYIKKGKGKVNYTILEQPAAGSNYYAPYGSVYPQTTNVCVVKK